MSFIADVNGLQLFYRDNGGGSPLLLLHGFTGSGDDWQHVFASPLPGYRIIAPDLRGHGRSTNPSGRFRALWRHARGFADDRDDMNFTPVALSSITRPHADRARRSRSAVSR